MTSNLKIGDPWPVEWKSSRGLTGRPISPPQWYALITEPMKEKAVADRLRNSGVIVRYPTQTKTRVQFGKKRHIVSPLIPRIIYAQFRYAPQWDVMKARYVIQGVFSRGNIPVELSQDDINRVMGLPTEAERIEEERRDAVRPKPGHKALIISGPLNGFYVDVTRTEAGRVWYEMASGLKGEAPEGMVIRAAE